MYVYIQFGTEFFPTKQPLIPRLARKNTGIDWGPHLILGRKIHSSRISIYSKKPQAEA